MRNPFIAGSWVRGDNFFGRTNFLREILDGSRDSLWVIGARRMGKTSLLKEVEARTQASKETPYLALYWDLQGSSDARGLADGLIASIEDNEHFRRAADIDIDAIEDLSVTDMLQAVIRRAVRSGWKSLILMDEGEELLTVARNDVATLGRLRRVLQKGPEVRSIITATRRLARLDETAALVTSPFLHGFLPPSYLTPLDLEETTALLARGGFADAAVQAIAEKTGNQPFLVQLIASRLFENKDLEGTLDVVANDDMVSNFFSVDYQTLELVERRILEEVAREKSLTPADIGTALPAPGETLGPHLLGLAQMGYLKQAGGRYSIGNWFFETWLRRQSLQRVAAPDTRR
jgi:hypothetical protein